VFAESGAAQLRVKAVLSIIPIFLQCQVRTKYVSLFSGGSGQDLGHGGLLDFLPKTHFLALSDRWLFLLSSWRTLQIERSRSSWPMGFLPNGFLILGKTRTDAFAETRHRLL